MRSRFVATVSLALCAGQPAASYAQPDPDAAPVGTIVYAGDDGLYAVAADGSGEPTLVAALREPGPAIGQIEGRGRIIQVDVGGVAGWVQLAPGEVRRIAVTRCTDPGRLSPDGALIACPAGPGATVLQPVMWKSRDIPIVADGFLGSSEIVSLTDSGIDAVSIADPTKRRPLAPHRPVGPLSIAPTGVRAAGVYDDGVYVFRLDGKAARRKLGNAALIPVAWSPDGRWLLLGDGKQACAVRAVGGEYKCWDGYAAVAVSPSSAHALLSRGGALYVAPIAGVSKARPKQLVDTTAPTAAWIPPL